MEAVRDPKLALSAANSLVHANEIQSDPQMFEVVAAAYAANHEYGNAVDAQRQAIQKAATLGWNTAAMQERLAAYRHDAPWVGDLYAALPAGR
jgi:predicted HAD superfamily Cof-like phosphohydrolase